MTTQKTSTTAVRTVSSFLPSLRALYEASDEYQRQIQVLPTGVQQSNSFNNFLKGGLWSPDGKVVLTASEDAVLRLYATPQNCSDSQMMESTPDLTEQSNNSVSTLRPWIEVDEGETIYDFSWYPLMDWIDPTSCYFATVSRDHPIHLYNPATGNCLSYVNMDAAESMVNTVSIAFHPDGHQLYGGADNMISVYDILRPGSPIQVSRLSMRRSKGKQKGIISAIATQPLSMELHKLVACGSYGKSIYLYDEGSDMSNSVTQLQDDTTTWGGVTQLRWVDEKHIISGHRSDTYMRMWDIRYPTKVITHFRRITGVHQRFLFDLYRKLLLTGDENGYIRLYDTTTYDMIGDRLLHKNTSLTSVNVHPSLPLLLTATGTFKFQQFDQINSCDNSDDEDVLGNAESITKDVFDNFLRIWSFRQSGDGV